MNKKSLKQQIIGIVSMICLPIIRFYWFLFRPKTTGIKCIVRYENEVLMIKNTYGRWPWTFPGGTVNKDEGLANAAEREVVEEVGVEIKNLRQIGQFESTKEYKLDLINVFVADAENKEIKIDTNEISDAQWFSLSNLPEITSYAQKMISMLK